MKFICSVDNFACIIDNIPNDASGPAIVFAALLISIAIATIWSKLS